MTSPAILIVAPTKRELGGLRETNAYASEREKDARAAIRETERDGDDYAAEREIERGADDRVRIALCGIGREAGERVAALLDAAPCSLLVSLGFAGALDPAIRPGDLIVADAFLYADALPLAPPAPLLLSSLPSFPRRRESSGRAAPDPLSLPGERDGERVLATGEERSIDGAQPRLHDESSGRVIPAKAGTYPRLDPLSLQGERARERVLATEEERGVDGAQPRLRDESSGRVIPAKAGTYPSGPILTVDAPLLTPAAKRRARAASGAAVVDMEGRRIAEAAAERGVPIVAVRAVIDEADFALPPFAAEIAAAGGHDERARAFRAAANPREAAGMLLLALRARKAARSLRRAADAILAAQPERP